MNNEKAIKLRYMLRIFLLAFAVTLVFYITFRFIPDVMSLLKNGDEKAMEEYIRNTGRSGVLIIVLLQVLQTLTIVFPGIPIYICSGIVFGQVTGTLICYITYVVVNIAIFVFSRSMGEAADVLFPDKKEDWVSELLNKTKHPMRLVMALCVVPLIPNGIIPHIAAKSKLTLREFFMAVAVGCVPGIFLFVFCGELILNGYFSLIIGLCALAIALMIVSYVFKDKISAIVNGVMERFSEKSGE